MSMTRDRVIIAKRAGRELANLSEHKRQSILHGIAEVLAKPEVRERLLAANLVDLHSAKNSLQKGELSPAQVDRLVLTEEKLEVLIASLHQLADSPECVNLVRERRLLDDKLILEKKTCPLGVLGVVFEARPDAIPQIAGLALKTGNAIVLKGGSEALHSNRALVVEIQQAIAKHGLDPSLLALLEDRSQVRELLELDDCVDLIVARGSSEFVQRMQKISKIPVMGHAEGLCHIYLHEDADSVMATSIVVDSKCSYPAACNAVETVLWHPTAKTAILSIVAKLCEEGVELRACEATRSLIAQAMAEPQKFEIHGRLGTNLSIKSANQNDFATEYCGKTLSIAQVTDLECALEHIEHYGSKHTEAIVTKNQEIAEIFLRRVDAACVFHNASTRFSDGYRFGLGAEVGVSTSKLHARGPVGVEGLLSYRWLLRGAGHVSADYGPKSRQFIHKALSPTSSN